MMLLNRFRDFLSQKIENRKKIKNRKKTFDVKYDIERQKRYYGNIAYHALDGRSDRESLLVHLQLRLNQSKLYGGMDDGHAWYWWKVWSRFEMSEKVDISPTLRKGCKEALIMGNTSTYGLMLSRITKVSRSGLSLTVRGSEKGSLTLSLSDWTSVDSEDLISTSESFTSGTTSDYIKKFSSKYDAWLYYTHSILNRDEVHMLTLSQAKIARANMLHDAIAYDDCLYPEPSECTWLDGMRECVKEAPL